MNFHIDCCNFFSKCLFSYHCGVQLNGIPLRDFYTSLFNLLFQVNIDFPSFVILHHHYNLMFHSYPYQVIYLEISKGCSFAFCLLGLTIHGQIPFAKVLIKFTMPEKQFIGQKNDLILFSTELQVSENITATLLVGQYTSSEMQYECRSDMISESIKSKKEVYRQIRGFEAKRQLFFEAGQIARKTQGHIKFSLCGVYRHRNSNAMRPLKTVHA